MEGLVLGGAYFRNFTVYFHVRVKLGVRKRKLSQIRQVSELMNEKLGHRVAMTTALVTIDPVSFLLSPFTMINIL